MNLPINDVKKLIINADDFGQSEAIDAAITDLAECRIINSTSALVFSPYWGISTNALVKLPIQVGLHLDLTSHFTHQFGCYHRLSQLIFAAYSRQLNLQHLEKIIELQWNRFTEVLGREPAFIDGHQHVHQLPIVRDALFSVIAKKGWGMQPENWLRICHTNHWRGFKAMVISSLGANRTKEMATRLGIKTNSDFAGVYNFKQDNDLEKLWLNWLNNLSGNMPAIMCHVAKANIKKQRNHSHTIHLDSIFEARVKEYNWLMSDHFRALLISKGYDK